jgi:drug/metabolite transporter (DMT)-like permease
VALLLTFASAVLWGLFDAARKRLVGSFSPIVLLVHIGLIQALVFGGPVLSGDSPGPSAAYWVPGLAVLVLNTAANLAFVTALQLAPLSRTVPLLSLTPVFAASGAYLRLGEAMSPRQVLGIALVVLGAYLLSRPRPEAQAEAEVADPEARNTKSGMLLMLVVAAAWGSNAPFDKEAVLASSVAFHATAQALGIALVFALWLGFKGRLRDVPKLKGRGPELLLAGLIGPAAVATQLQAFTLTDVALVEVAKRVVGLVMAVAIGRWAFAEKLEGDRIWALVAMAVGLPLVLL